MDMYVKSGGKEMEKKEKENNKDIDSRQEWLDYLEWKIETEKTTTTWSGISIWLILGAIGVILYQLYEVIKVEGINYLVNDESMYLIISLFGISLLVYINFRRYYSKKIQSNNNDMLVLFVALLFLVIFVLALLFSKSFRHNSLMIISMAYIWILLLSTMDSHVAFNETDLKKRLKRKYIVRHHIVSYRERKRFFKFFIIVILGCSLLNIMLLDFSQYSLETGTNIAMFAILIYILFMCIIMVIRLSIEKESINKLIEYRDLLFMDSVDIDIVKDYILKQLHGEDAKKMLDEKIDKIVEKAKYFGKFQDDMIERIKQGKQEGDKLFAFAKDTYEKQTKVYDNMATIIAESLYVLECLFIYKDKSTYDKIVKIIKKCDQRMDTSKSIMKRCKVKMAQCNNK